MFLWVLEYSRSLLSDIKSNLALWRKENSCPFIYQEAHEAEDESHSLLEVLFLVLMTMVDIIIFLCLFLLLCMFSFHIKDPENH